MNKLEATLATLREAAEQSDSVCVAYSGGKDSMTVLDLCCRTFKRVEAFYMYFVPGLASEEDKLKFATERFGVKVRQMPHWASLRSLSSWTYVDPQPALDFLPTWSLEDCYQRMLADTGCAYVAVGAKKADSSWRRRFMKGTEHWKFMLNPIAEWNKFDVLGYLAAQKIPIPVARAGKNATGLDCSIASLVHLHEKAPDDFKIVERYFNLAGAALAHHEFYGRN